MKRNKFWIGLVVSIISSFTVINELKQNSETVLYLPIIRDTSTNVLLPPIPRYSETIIDYDSLYQDLEEYRYLLGTNKIGFHIGSGGNITGLYDMMKELDDNRIPFFLKSADVAGTLWEGQQLKLSSGVDHTLVYRKSGDDYDVPEYDLSPNDAAILHWNLHKSVFPPELIPSQVWLETVNEVDKNRSEWLAEFLLITAQLALRDGFNYAAFSWSSGEPESYQWEGEKMLEFLRFAGNNPTRVAIALHEYSYITTDIADGYPYKVGRFQELFAICDKHHIPRPTILITEWGWEYQNIPTPEQAMKDIEWVNRLYNAYPQVKGGAIWYLGGGFGDIDSQTNRLIEPLTEYSLHNYFEIEKGQGTIDPSIFYP